MIRFVWLLQITVSLSSVLGQASISVLYNKENFNTLLLRRKDLMFAVLEAYVECNSLDMASFTGGLWLRFRLWM